jgi:lysophospholipase L1-like esterase
MIRRSLLLSFALAQACTPRPDTARPPVGTTAAPAPVSAAAALDRYESEIVAFETADRAMPHAPGGILFVGSSSIRRWTTLAADFPALPVLNRGFGGSTLREVNHYAPRIVLPYQPRLIVLYAGDNDIAMGRTPAQVADDYRTFVRIVREALPVTRIIFVSVKPSPSRWSLIDRAREANALVRAIVEHDTLQTFVDVVTPMLRADGRPRPELFVGDSLHMTAAGYAIWRDRLTPLVH